MGYRLRIRNLHTATQFLEWFATLPEATYRGQWYRTHRNDSHEYEIINLDTMDVIERWSAEGGLRRNYLSGLPTKRYN